MKHLVITFLIVHYFNVAIAQQQPYVIQVINIDNEVISKLSGLADSIKFEKVVASTYNKWMRKGYILTSVQKVKEINAFKASIEIGKKYVWGKFNIDYVPEALLSKAGYHKSQFLNARVNSKILGSLLVKLLEESDKAGYPFASIKLDSVTIINEEISAVLAYSAGFKIKYGTLHVNSDFVKSKYLESYLGIKEGDLFNANKVVGINRKINKLTYCKTAGFPAIKFDNKSCHISLKLRPIKANKVDAMLGLAPNQIDKSKLLATGYINLDLHNLFKSGKRLMFNWRQFGVQSQTLKTSYNHTNLFGSIINVKGNFEIFKQDTTFINRTFKIDIGYDIANYTVNFTSSFISSRLLSNVDISNSNLELIDFNANYYGVEFLTHNFDHLLNPRKGWSVKANVNLGTKNILSTSFVPPDVYDSLTIQSLQGSYLIFSEVAVPLSNLLVGYTKLQLGGIESNGELFNNDLMRLGGVNSIRGFNELEIYASRYAMLQVEARLLLGENSRLFGFMDWAYAENSVAKNNDTFIGVGTGLLLDTSSGVIQLVYAVGKSSKQSLSLANSKIHIGYVAKF